MFKEEARIFLFCGLVGDQFYFVGDQPGAVEDEAEVEAGGAFAVADEFQQGVFGGDGTVEIEKGDLSLHSFNFLNRDSGMLLMSSMIQRQNHLT